MQFGYLIQNAYTPINPPPKGEKTLLWSGNQSTSGTIYLSESGENFDALMVVAEITATGGAYGVALGVHTNLCDTNALYQASKSNLLYIADVGSFILIASNVAPTQFDMEIQSSQYVGKLIAVYGIKQ